MSMQSECSVPLWMWNDGKNLDRPALTTNLDVEVAVVGAGIAGLSIAYRLASQGHQVAVVDDGRIGGGNTARTTAHLSNVLDDRFASLRRKRGAAIARIAAESIAPRSTGSKLSSGKNRSVAASSGSTAICCWAKATTKTSSTRSSMPRAKPDWP